MDSVHSHEIQRLLRFVRLCTDGVAAELRQPHPDHDRLHQWSERLQATSLQLASLLMAENDAPPIIADRQ